MTDWNFAARPADQCQVTGQRGGVFYVGEPLTFTFSAPAGLGTPATPTSWEVRTYDGTVVASGAGTGSTLNVPAQPPGWYKLYLKRATPVTTWGLNQGEYHFQVWRQAAGFAARPGGAIDPNTRNVITDRGPLLPADLAMRGMTLGGLERYTIADAANPGSDLTAAVQAAALDANYYLAHDSARPKVQVCHFRDGTEGVGAAAGVTQVVQELGPIWYECRNEPQATAPATFIAELQRFRDMVKAANPAAKVLGPNPVSINATTNAAPWFDSFLALGGAQYLDGLSWHDYNAVNGDLILGRAVYDRHLATLVKHGVQAMPRFMSEWGTFGNAYRSFTPRRQARWWGMSLLLWEQYGLPKERVFNFYGVAHGFANFPSYGATYDLSPYPIVTLQRVYSEEVYGKTFAARLDFGAVENDHYLGCRFDGADGSAVVALVSAGRTDGAVTFTVAGATSLTRIDTWGNAVTLTAAGGRVVCPVAETPCYLRVPVGVTATVVPRVYGRNVMHDRSPALAVSSGGAAAAKVVNRVAETYYDTLTAETAAFTDPAATLPATLTINLGQRSTFDTVIVRCPPPWQSQGSLLDYDLQYLADNGTTWVTLQTVTEPKQHFAITSDYYVGHGGYSETYWSERHTFVHNLGQQVTSTAIRLYVRDCSKGGELDLVDPSDGQGAAGKYISFREIEVYNRQQATTSRYVRK